MRSTESNVRLAGVAVVFDSDGVLVDSDASVIRAWTTWSLRHDLDPAAVLPFVHGQPVRATVAMFRSKVDAPAAISEIHALELADGNRVTALPGAARLLAQIPAPNWAVATSATAALARARLVAAGLPSPSVLVTADDVRRGKPDPECYLRAFQLLAVPPRRGIVVEDAPSGIVAARSAGVETIVGVGPRAMGSGATFVIRDLRALTWSDTLTVSRAALLE